MKLGEPDASGRRRPVEVKGSEFTIQADMVIAAIGQVVDEELLGHISVKSSEGRFKIDPVTAQTSVPGVFAGGDNVTGPSTVIEAVAAGKRAAESIERYLKGRDLLGGRFEESLRPIPQAFMPTLDKVGEEIPSASGRTRAGQPARKF